MALNRSEQMARIRGYDTKPELRLRQALWARGLRYRIGFRHDFGRPDLTSARHRLVVFVDGCFWHGCPEHYSRPQTRPDFWARKLAENVRRDQLQTASAESAGWRVERIWEHEVDEDVDQLAESLCRRLATGGVQDRFEHWQVVRAEVLPGGRFERRRLEELRAQAKPRELVFDAGNRRGPEGASVGDVQPLAE